MRSGCADGGGRKLGVAVDGDTGAVRAAIVRRQHHRVEPLLPGEKDENPRPLPGDFVEILLQLRGAMLGGVGGKDLAPRTLADGPTPLFGKGADGP